MKTDVSLVLKLFSVVAILLVGVLLTYDYRVWKTEHAFYINVMETYDDLNGAEVDEIWRFRKNNGTSKRFEELYQQKVKDLPGGDWSSSTEEIRWRK